MIMRILQPAVVCLALAGSAAGASLAADEGGIRGALVAAPVSAKLGGDTTVAAAGGDAFTQLAANAPTERSRDFALGSRLFAIEWVPFPNAVKIFDGLGPTLNHDACAGCHAANGRGRPPGIAGGAMESMLVRLSAGDGGPLPEYGDQLNDRSIDGVDPEGRAIIEYEEVDGTYGDGTPYTLLRPGLDFADLAFGSLDGALTRSSRRTDFDRARPARSRSGGNAGRPRRPRRRGRRRYPAASTASTPRAPSAEFGWKSERRRPSPLDGRGGDRRHGAHHATLPRSELPAGTGRLHRRGGRKRPRDQRRLPRPDRHRNAHRGRAGAASADDPDVTAGLAAFRRWLRRVPYPDACDGRHRRPAGLRDQTFHPFTDLLLHDMGEGLADGRPDHDASRLRVADAAALGAGAGAGGERP